MRSIPRGCGDADKNRAEARPVNRGPCSGEQHRRQRNRRVVYADVDRPAGFVRRDTPYPMSGMQGSVDKLTRLYSKAGMPERFRGTFYDEPHSFTSAMQEEAFDWMDRWL